jgi:hypothetical protein
VRKNAVGSAQRVQRVVGTRLRREPVVPIRPYSERSRYVARSSGVTSSGGTRR